MDSLLHAVRHAVRRLARRPGWTMGIVAILALGIGASTGVFSVARPVLLRPIPVAELDRLVVAWETDPWQSGSLIEVSFPYFLDWRAESSSFDDMAAFGSVMTRLVDRALAPWRFTSALLAGFAFAALVLTASGLFAVLHLFVSGRTREIAIRMALGAEPRRVRTFVLTQGLAVTALGLTLGLPLSLVLARSLSALLYGVNERDPWSYLGAVALIGPVAAVACMLPARRASSVELTVVLRSE